MRITYVGPVPPLRGGISQHGGRLVRALREAAHDVEVLSWSAQYPRLLFKGEQVDVRSEPHESGTRFCLQWWNPLSWLGAGRSAARSDLLLFPWVTPFLAVPLRVVLAATRKTPSVALVHNPLPHERQPFDRSLTRWALRHVRSVVVHSERVGAELAALVSVPKVVTVPFPPLLDLEATPLPATPPLRLLFLGFVRRYKGLETAIEAVELLARRGRDVTLTVAGEFWEPVDSWRARVGALESHERIRLQPGYVSDAELGALLQSHHVLVAPYVAASQSGIVPLALAAGRPVVATNVGGLPEQVREGVTGALAPPADPAAFADGVERVWDSLASLASNARASSPSWGDVVHAVLEAAE